MLFKHSSSLVIISVCCAIGGACNSLQIPYIHRLLYTVEELYFHTLPLSSAALQEVLTVFKSSKNNS